MNLSAALLKRVIETSDSEVWGKLRPHYLPPEYLPLYKAIDKHFTSYLALPTFDELKLGVRSPRLLEEVHALHLHSVDADADVLLEHLKNEFTQKELLTGIKTYLSGSILLDNAEESLEHLEDIILDVRDKVELEEEDESMQDIDPVLSEEEIADLIPLGFNSEFDALAKYGRGDLILVGGKRGKGKSLTCANIIASQFKRGNSGQYFTIEMRKKPIFQRMAAISCGIKATKLSQGGLDSDDYFNLAKWQASRFEGGEEVFLQFAEHRDYSRFHKEVTKCSLKKENQIDIVYSSSMTVSKVRAEVERLKRQAGDNLTVVAVDYINQVRRSNSPNDRYDWKEQVEISADLKQIAQDYGVLMFVPYQIDNTGEARYAKGILDAADASFILDSYSKKDKCITFASTKMRGLDDEMQFTSVMDWDTLKIGPQPTLTPKEKSELEEESSEDI